MTSNHEIEYESSARAIADSVLDRSGRLIPKELKVLVGELLANAAHDGIEFGESVVGLMDSGPSPLEHYHRGFMDALKVVEQGQIKGEQ